MCYIISYPKFRSEVFGNTNNNLAEKGYSYSTLAQLLLPDPIIVSYEPGLCSFLPWVYAQFM